MGIVTRGKGNKHLRLVVPKELRQQIGRRDIFKSLKTDSERAARKIEASLDKGLFWAVLKHKTDGQNRAKISQTIENLLSDMLESSHAEIPFTIDFPPTRTQSHTFAPETCIRLSELAQIRIRQLRATGRAHKTILAAESQSRKIVDIMGDHPLNEYKHLDFLHLQETLQNSLAPRTAYARLITTATLFKYAAEHGYIKENPCPRFEKPKSIKHDIGYHSYEPDDIARLLASPYFRNGKPDHRGMACLISLYSGLRIGELAQLHTCDIVEQEGIRCFSINEDGNKQVKSFSSIRLVPIHPKLTELGIDSLGNGKRLFPEFVNDGMGYGHNFSKAYGKFNRRHISKDRNKVFHSWRKTFSRALSESGVHQETIAALLGHRPQSEVTALYSGGVALLTMRDAVMKLSFTGI